VNPWKQQCPARGYGLTHAHDTQCKDGHIAGQCCECGGFPGPQVAEHTHQFSVPPPLDVTARMKALGLLQEDTGMEDIRAEHDDNTPVEPKMITGNGPEGKPDGKGRGDLTYRQEMRIMRWKAFILEIGGDDAPEH
jgi:hypothetical protein